MSTIDQQIQSNLTAYMTGLEAIENAVQVIEDTGVTIPAPPESKRQAKRDLFDKHFAEYNRLADLKRQEVDDNLSKARQRMFRTVAAGYEPEIAMSQRDAADRLEGVNSIDELQRRLETAFELNDKIMCRAILRKGVEFGQDFGGVGLVQSYLRMFPGEAEAYSQLEDASLEHERLQVLGVGGTPPNPEDPSRTFRGSGQIPENLITYQQSPAEPQAEGQ
jgi:hypothetical protein